jgi:hypothetical protein
MVVATPVLVTVEPPRTEKSAAEPSEGTSAPPSPPLEDDTVDDDDTLDEDDALDEDDTPVSPPLDDVLVPVLPALEVDAPPAPPAPDSDALPQPAGSAAKGTRSKPQKDMVRSIEDLRGSRSSAR